MWKIFQLSRLWLRRDAATFAFQWTPNPVFYAGALWRRSVAYPCHPIVRFLVPVVAAPSSAR